MYTQVLLKNGANEQTCWVESQYAEVGLWLGLEECPEETWKVSKVFSEVDKKALDMQRKCFKVFESKTK